MRLFSAVSTVGLFSRTRGGAPPVEDRTLGYHGEALIGKQLPGAPSPAFVQEPDLDYQQSSLLSRGGLHGGTSMVAIGARRSPPSRHCCALLCCWVMLFGLMSFAELRTHLGRIDFASLCDGMSQHLVNSLRSSRTFDNGDAARFHMVSLGAPKSRRLDNWMQQNRAQVVRSKQGLSLTAISTILGVLFAFMAPNQCYDI